MASSGVSEKPPAPWRKRRPRKESLLTRTLLEALLEAYFGGGKPSRENNFKGTVYASS